MKFRLNPIKTLILFLILGISGGIGLAVWKTKSKNSDEVLYKYLGIKSKPKPLFYSVIGQNQEELSQSKPEEKRYTIAIREFRSLERAKKLVTFMNKKGIPAYYSPYHINGKVIYKVRYGVFPSYDTASESMLALKKLGFKEKPVEVLN